MSLGKSHLWFVAGATAHGLSEGYHAATSCCTGNAVLLDTGLLNVQKTFGVEAQVIVIYGYGFV